MKIRSHLRSFSKAVSWRLLGSVDTFLLGFLLSGKLAIGLSIAGTEVLTKTFLYYGHERVWSIIKFGADKMVS